MSRTSSPLKALGPGYRTAPPSTKTQMPLRSSFRSTSGTGRKERTLPSSAFRIPSNTWPCLMVQEAHGQDLAIIELIVNLHRTFTTSCGYQEDESWRLTGRLIRRFCVHLHEVRSIALGVDDLSTTGSKALVMWAMMKSLKTAKDILDMGFSAHPIIIQEVMEFQLEHRVDASHLAAILKVGGGPQGAGQGPGVDPGEIAEGQRCPRR